MDQNKQKISEQLETYRPELERLADDIFDHPEIGLEETYASGLLCDWLEANGIGHR